MLIFLQDAKKDTVALTLTYDGVTEVLNLYLQDYSGVLVDCLRGNPGMLVMIMTPWAGVGSCGIGNKFSKAMHHVISPA